MLQKSGAAIRIPTVASVSPAMATGRPEAYSTLITSPKAASAMGTATCQRRSL